MLLIALGANAASARRGPRATLEGALALLAAVGLDTMARSGWYSTPAFPAGAGPDYVNAVARLRRGGRPAEAVLALLHEVEEILGRERSVRWGPRTCDLDLLACGDSVLPDAATVRGWMAREGEAAMQAPPELILPHPRLHERGFVLAPMAEIAPDWRHPLTGRSVREMLEALPAEALAGVTRIDD